VKVSRDNVERRLAELREICEQKGLKLTHQRMEIYRELASSQEHPDAEAVYQRLRKRIPTISPDTVYRNLKLLTEQGLISVVGMSNERLRFDANMAAHHHFVCIKCGLIRDFSCGSFDASAMPEEASSFGEPVSMHLEVKGVCTACRPRSKRSK
jgi:Fur family transcriptional regulator, peroxide stress response regulator